MTTKRVTLTAETGPFEGEIALPPGEGRAPAVLLFQEWWGVNDHIRSLVSRLAAEGFVVFAPDLYDGKTTRDAGEAGQLMGSLDWPKALDRAKASVKWLAAHERGNGKVAVTGFCLGGALTLATASIVPEVAAAVSFYGMPDRKNFDLASIKAPILAHVATRDDWVKPAAAEALRDDVNKAGGTMKVEQYESDHAFVNDTRPEVYDAANAKLAWSRSVDFIKQHTS
ncbi:MAG: dienelactone hydrolase family protein [Polyangiaceae bacterium]|nr:dienelactone hydrolase family protein [Polyangiaceae bacterium]